MGIKFTQYVLPHGRRREEVIERSAEIEALADKFIESGGYFECEILTTGHVSLTAVKEIDGEPQDVEIELVPNGPGVLDAVDRLVQKAKAHA